jgi:hypothetical protein
MIRKGPVTIEDARSMAEAFAREFTNHLQQKTTSAAGSAIAAVLMGKERRDITAEEAAQALETYRNGKEEGLRNEAARAGVSAMLAALEPYLPQQLIAEVVHAFTGLDGGVARGIATPTKSRRREGAPDYDALAVFVAAEAFHTKALFKIRSDDAALMQATGVMRPGAKNPPDPTRVAIPLTGAGVTWRQVTTLYKRGISLLGAGGKADAIRAGKDLATGVEVEPDFAGHRAHWLQIFADDAVIREAINMARKSKPPRPEPTRKRTRKSVC